MLRPTILILCLILSFTSSAQMDKLPDSIKLQIKEECFRRLKKDQMKEFPGYFQSQTDSLRKVREGYFKENLTWVIETTKKYGCPVGGWMMYEDDIMDRKYPQWTSLFSTTFIHIFQSNPALALEKDVVKTLASAMKRGELQKVELTGTIDWYRKSKPCKNYLKRINYAMKEWGMKPFAEKDLSNCK